MCDQKLRKIVFIYGSGRSGTTWFEERIAHALRADVIFEPLKDDQGMVAKRYGYACLDRKSDAALLSQYFDSLIYDGYSTLWTRYRIIKSRLMPSLKTVMSLPEFKAWVKRYIELIHLFRRYYPMRNANNKLIKLIRANLLGDWLQEQYPQAHHFYLVRHPAAVIESRMRLDRNAQESGLVIGNDDWNPKEMLRRYSDKGLPVTVQKKLNAITANRELDDFQTHCLLWCVENVEIMNRKGSVLFYEHLVDNKNEVWSKLAEILNISISQLLDGMSLPSQQSRNNSGNIGKKDILEAIQKENNGRGLEYLQCTLDKFNIDFYDTFDLLPKYISLHG